jgi:hypothetical protein
LRHVARFGELAQVYRDHIGAVLVIVGDELRGELEALSDFKLITACAAAEQQ